MPAYSFGRALIIFLEYEQAEAFDDVVILTAKGIRAVQAKYAMDPLAVYAPEDFTSTESRTYFGRYAAGWMRAGEAHPGQELTLELLSNRGRDSTLEGIIGTDGQFTTGFIEGRIRKEAKAFRDTLQKACGFAGPDADAQFKAFLRAFQFSLAQRSLRDLRNHIEGELLDHQLGISDRGVFHELKELVERHAIEFHNPITPALLNEIFRAVQRRFLLPQVFPVDKKRFVEVRTFRDALLTRINATDAGYIVVTGLPGSGKSTSLSEFFDSLQGASQLVVCVVTSVLSDQTMTLLDCGSKRRRCV